MVPVLSHGSHFDISPLGFSRPFNAAQGRRVGLAAVAMSSFLLLPKGTQNAKIGA